MRWSDVRNHYPEQWVLIEAIDATSKSNKRIVEQISVIEAYQEDSKER